MNERAESFVRKFGTIDGVLLFGAILALASAAVSFPPLSSPGGVLGGALIGVLVSRYYSRKTSKELDEAVDNLGKATGLLALYLYDAGVLPKQPVLNKHGHLKGWPQRIELKGVQSDEVVGRLTAQQGEPPPPTPDDPGSP
jgi:hypothetical protein